ncbi:hypothetical protein FQR65_LT18073 [Abscondita terminalis]|nr:hypothetical protein FQR65_LT18073 [Abscondita terminalis]
MLNKFVKAIKNPADWEKLQAEYKGKTNDKKQPLANFNEGEMVESAEVFTKYNVPFKTGVYTTKIGGRTLIIANDEILPAGFMTQKEAEESGELEELKQSKELKADADNRLSADAFRGFPSEQKDMLNAYKFRTAYDFKAAMKNFRGDQYYQERLSNRLKKIKAAIQGGESFENQARIYSEDPGSASNGGLISNVAKGMMVKPFEAAALNMQEGEISDPVETEFGYHIIQLIKKSEEIKAAKNELQKVKAQIVDGTISFKDAALKYSDDKSYASLMRVMTGFRMAPINLDNKMDPVDAYQNWAGLNIR